MTLLVAISLLIVEAGWPASEPAYQAPQFPKHANHAVITLATLRTIHDSLDYRFTYFPRAEYIDSTDVLFINLSGANMEPMWLVQGWSTMLVPWTKAGVPVILSAGNGSMNLNRYPWWEQEVIVVGALTETGRWSQSNQGERVDVWAYGRDPVHGTMGTSWAGPRVAAWSVKILERYPMDGRSLRHLWRKHGTYQGIMDHLTGFPVWYDKDGDGLIGYSDFLTFIQSFRARRLNY